jgi:hypothetical protein
MSAASRLSAPFRPRLGLRRRTQRRAGRIEHAFVGVAEDSGQGHADRFLLRGCGARKAQGRVGAGAAHGKAGAQEQCMRKAPGVSQLLVQPHALGH